MSSLEQRTGEPQASLYRFAAVELVESRVRIVLDAMAIPDGCTAAFLLLGFPEEEEQQISVDMDATRDSGVLEFERPEGSFTFRLMTTSVNPSEPGQRISVQPAALIGDQVLLSDPFSFVAPLASS